MFVLQAKEAGVAIIVARYLDNEEHKVPPPSIRIAVSSELTKSEIDNSIKTIALACNEVLNR